RGTYEQARAVCIRPGESERRDAHHVGGEASGNELLDELAGRDDDLSAQMPTLLRGGKLVLEMDAGRAGLDHCLRDLECMEGPAKSGLRVRDDRREPIAVVGAVHVRLLVFPSERVV